jgi:hypothetical protein
MKSNRKPIYNHRIAQNKSTEDWETKFVSELDAPKVKNIGNNLLYLAATKLFGARKETYKDYYTEDNKQSIIDKIKEIANNPYNLKNHPKFQENIDLAIQQLDKEIAKNPKNPDSGRPTTGVPENVGFGSDAPTTDPGVATPSVAPELATDRKPQPGKTYFTPDYREAFRDLDNVLTFHNLYPESKAKEVIEYIQREFLNKYPGDTNIAGLPDAQNRPYSRVAEFNRKIKRYNDKWKTKLKELVVLPLSI